MAGEAAGKKQMGVALSDDLRGRLNAASEAAGRSVAEEIRQRLERTFTDDDLDPVTRELIDGLIKTAAKLQVDFGHEWHTWPRAHQAFVAAVAQWIADYAPPPRAGPPGVSDLFGPDDPPETIGKMRARDVQREHNFSHVKAAQRRRTGAALSARHIKAKGDKQ